MKVKTFEDLEIWKISTDVTLDIYGVTKNECFHRDFSLVDQIRRASISISSNIAEGYERNNNNEFIHFLKIAKGSAGEVRSQLIVAFRLQYLSLDEYDELSEKLLLLSNKMGKLITYLVTKKKNNEFLTR